MSTCLCVFIYIYMKPCYYPIFACPHASMPMIGAGKGLSDMLIGDFEDCPPTTSF